MLNELASYSELSRKAAAAEVVRRRNAEISEITTLVEQCIPVPEKKAIVRDAVRLLGELRAVQAVPLLTRLLTYQVPYLATRPQPIEDQCPAVMALIDIGMPSIPPVLQRLRSEDGDILQRAGAAVFRGVIGESLALITLDGEVRSATSPIEAGRLAAVMQRLRELPK